MDTFKDKQQLDDLYESGQPPWEVWRRTTAAAFENRVERETKTIFGAPTTKSLEDRSV